MRRTALAVAVALVLGGFSQRAFAEKQPKMEEALVHLRIPGKAGVLRQS